jgi:hypothetical protein
MSDHFEDAVQRMLDDVARVDRSLLEEARGTIAALPNRRVGVTYRVQRSVARRMPGRGRFALAGAAAVVVAVVAVSILGPLQSRPSGPNSASPSGAPPSAALSGSASAAPLPSAIRTGPAYSETLPVLLTGSHVAFAGWSPDGSRYALSVDATNSSVLHLFDRSGTEVGSVAGVGMYAFAWLDADRFVFLSNHGNGTGGVGTFLGRVGSNGFTEIGQHEMLVPGPAGWSALTLASEGDPSVNLKHQYVVLSADGSVSKPRDGDPVGWSRDGSMLAVYHATGLAPEPSGVERPTIGSLEIVRPTGEHVASTQKLSFASPSAIAFSPDGARLAFGYDAAPLKGTGQTAVLEIRTGHVTIIPESGPLTWASSDQLLVAYTSIDYGKTPSAIMAWSATTGRVATYGRGDIVGASGLGTVVIGSDTAHDFTWMTTAGGSTRTGTFTLGYYLGFGPSISDNSWSPDGSSLILTVGDWNNGTPMDAVLFQP